MESPDGRTGGRALVAAADTASGFTALEVLSRSNGTLLVVSARLPACPPGLFGGNRTDGITAIAKMRRNARTVFRSITSSRDRVQAAGVERMASQNSTNTQPGAAHRAVALDCLDHVHRAARCESAGRRKWRRRDLIQSNQADERATRQASYAQSDRSHRSRSSARSLTAA